MEYNIETDKVVCFLTQRRTSLIDWSNTDPISNNMFEICTPNTMHFSLTRSTLLVAFDMYAHLGEKRSERINLQLFRFNKMLLGFNVFLSNSLSIEIFSRELSMKTNVREIAN